jgi:hypothetical protein
MAYSIVPTVAVGDLWTAAQHNAYIKDNFAAGCPDILTTAGDLIYGSAADTAARLALGTSGRLLGISGSAPAWVTPPTGKGCLVTHSANQTVNDTTDTWLSFNTETFDNGGYHDTVTSNSRITIPDGLAGKYRCYAAVDWYDDAGGSHIMRIVKNRTTYLFETIGESLAISLDAESLFAVATADLSVGDYLEIMVWQNTGLAGSIHSGVGLYFGVDLLR